MDTISLGPFMTFAALNIIMSGVSGLSHRDTGSARSALHPHDFI